MAVIATMATVTRIINVIERRKNRSNELARPEARGVVINKHPKGAASFEL